MKKLAVVAVLLAGAGLTSPAFARCSDAIQDLQSGPRLTDKAQQELREAQYQLQHGSESGCMQHARNAMDIMRQEARSNDRRYDDRYDDRRYGDRRYDDRYDRRYDDRYDRRYDDRSSSGSSNPLGTIFDSLGGRR
jgi:hypothetical protein